MQIFGPWYTLAETLELLGIRDSELRYLLQKKALAPVLYSTERSWLLHRRGREGWTGYGLCRYRGPVLAHPDIIGKLLDGESAYIGTGGGKLLEPDNISRMAFSYPYKCELPHGPLVAWKTERASRDEIMGCLATPAPEEITPPAYLLNELVEKLKELPGAPDMPSRAPVDEYKLNFTTGKPFEPSDIRIPKSEIESYQREVAAGIPPDKGSPKKRVNALHEILLALIQAHPDTPDKSLWTILQNDVEADVPVFNRAGLITEMDDLCIEWRGSKGKPQSLKFESFSPTLSRLRNRK